MFFLFCGLLLSVLLLVNLPAVQKFIARQATSWLSDKLQTTVSISDVRIHLLNRVSIRGVYVEDRAGDTLLYAGSIKIRASDLIFPSRGVATLRYAGFEDIYCRLYRTSDSDLWNYAFIEEYFGGNRNKKKPPSQKQEPFKIDLRKINLSNIRFFMDDAWVGSDFNITIGKGEIEGEKIRLEQKQVGLRHIRIEHGIVALRDYPGGRPPRTTPPPGRSIDTTAFNPDNWQFSVGELSLENSTFSLDVAGHEPYPGEFDPDHIGITEINIDADNISITGDTIKGKIKHLAARERCGIAIHHMEADVTVSPNASVCKNLLLVTDHSRIENYYAMHYERFPDFEDYIEKVKMTAVLNKATISPKDIAFFAPVLHDHPYPVVYASGSINGTVAHIQGKGLEVTDGDAFLKGDLRISGLPDISRTFFHYTSGALFTSGKNILRYTPDLKKQQDINVTAISYLHFKGDYAGYIDNFGVNGIIQTNLGTIISDVKLDIPDFNARDAAYSGTVKTNSFHIGRLLRNDLLGETAFNIHVKGRAFDQHTASIALNGAVSRIDLNGYPYQNIQMEGILAQKKFDGTLLINDPNLILAFYGGIDFHREQLQLSARANLLHSDFHALKLTKDTVRATADFDLNFEGNNIDDFTGYAKLYHINILRDKNRLDIDSVYFTSTPQGDQEVMRLESNDITGVIQGDFRLTDLPSSLQYYLFRYLPHYIPAPQEEIVRHQELNVTLQTRHVDTLLSVLLPGLVSGFDNSMLNASFNTADRKLGLEIRSPGGKISGITLKNISVAGIGNLDQLTLDASAGNMIYGNDILSATLVAQARLGQDSLHFSVSTETEEEHTKAVLNGEAYASGDSLYLHLLPSEILLNNHRWEIPPGNRFVFAKEYMQIDHLQLHSGRQKIHIGSVGNSVGKSLHADIKDMNIAMVGNLFGLASYSPSGQINGSLTLNNIFSQLKVESRMVATNVQFGKDTIGTLRLSGSYDEADGTLHLDRESGIYLGSSFIRTTGNMSLDSNSTQLLDGNIQLQNARLSWVAPFLSEYLTGMQGSLNGNIRIGGSAVKPDLQGSIRISDALVKIQMTGVQYSIPDATVEVNNKEIDFGTVTLFDAHKNKATLTGAITHDRFRNMRFARTRITSPRFTVLNVTEKQNKNFYGDLTAQVKSLSVSGPFDDIRMNIQAAPVARSHIYIPVQNSEDIYTYSYVSFKSREEHEPLTVKNKSKFSLSLTGEMNSFATITLVLDPASGDMINATGHGNITLNLPSNDDMTMFGVYEVDNGDYTFTFRQLYFRRNFKINSGSKIAFNGPINHTSLDIDAVYTTRARLSDILQEREKQVLPENELRDVKTTQDVNVLLHMGGTLSEPKLNFNIDLPEKRSEGTYAYQKLKRLNQNDRELFDQVASLLLINTFYPPEGLLGSSAISGGVSNLSEILSTTASSQLTNMMNKLLNDPNLAVELKYKNYQLSDPASYAGINRNEVSVNVRKTLFEDRLVVELGSVYDWGRPAAMNSNSSNLNLAGDFRLQYLLTQDGRFRFNAFRTTNYDVLINDNIYRGGIGISYRKSFNTFGELFRRKKSLEQQAE